MFKKYFNQITQFMQLLEQSDKKFKLKTFIHLCLKIFLYSYSINIQILFIIIILHYIFQRKFLVKNSIKLNTILNCYYLQVLNLFIDNIFPTYVGIRKSRKRKTGIFTDPQS